MSTPTVPAREPRDGAAMDLHEAGHLYQRALRASLREFQANPTQGQTPLLLTVAVGVAGAAVLWLGGQAALPEPLQDWLHRAWPSVFPAGIDDEGSDD